MTDLTTPFSLGLLLRDARKAHGLTQREVAERAGVSVSAVSELEKHDIGSMSKFQRIAVAAEFRLAGISAGRSFGEQVRNKRLQRGWSLKAVAARAGLTEATIKAVEENKGTTRSLCKVVAAIGAKSRSRAPERSYWRGGERDVRLTPPGMINAIEEAFGPIDCDPCHHPSSFVRPRKLAHTIESDGLTNPWEGDLAFVNPPFSALAAWVQRCQIALMSGEVRTIVALLPVRTETKAFQDHILGKADILLLKGRMTFHGIDGAMAGTAPFPMCLVIWRGGSKEVALLSQLVSSTRITASAS